MIKPILVVIVSLAIFIYGCHSKRENNAAQTPPSVIPVVDVLIARPQSIVSQIEANGTVVANEYVELKPEVSGRLTYLNVPEGKYVTKGTVIATMNDADLQAQLAKSKVLLQLAEITEARNKKLLAINGINQSDYDASLNQVQSIRADMAYTRALIDKTVIKAPFDGVMGLRQVSLGAYLTPANTIASLQQLNQVKIDFTLPEEYARYIRKGNTVMVQSDAAVKPIQKATIIAAEPQINTATRNIKIRAVLEEGGVNPGAFVKVLVATNQDKKAILVPTNALIPDDKNKQAVLVKHGKAFFVNVETGLRQADAIEITKGIQPGDSVVVTGVLFARPQNAVQVRSIKQLTDFSN
ncbi:MAG: efflux RND transporter periplasmic adaptor subunit [Hydrotalea flava]|uniref:efflux RND transporter periplasmic adaptor subunit n=1 Tax=Hydrotalea TaxID=1004300 RepID=UPI001C4477F7|nr:MULTISPECIES: efflux RND transporter periplasmic adaptor subunit [Hydrotalea]MBY0348240.1 efflux RND transporter periplasmic adaptor subunit [Hydrotalea flava]